MKKSIINNQSSRLLWKKKNCQEGRMWHVKSSFLYNSRIVLMPGFSSLLKGVKCSEEATCRPLCRLFAWIVFWKERKPRTLIYQNVLNILCRSTHSYPQTDGGAEGRQVQCFHLVLEGVFLPFGWRLFPLTFWKFVTFLRKYSSHSVIMWRESFVPLINWDPLLFLFLGTCSSHCYKRLSSFHKSRFPLHSSQFIFQGERRESLVLIHNNIKYYCKFFYICLDYHLFYILNHKY